VDISNDESVFEIHFNGSTELPDMFQVTQREHTEAGCGKSMFYHPGEGIMSYANETFGLNCANCERLIVTAVWIKVSPSSVRPLYRLLHGKPTLEWAGEQAAKAIDSPAVESEEEEGPQITAQGFRFEGFTMPSPLAATTKPACGYSFS
jgi:hypothetical protein